MQTSIENLKLFVATWNMGNAEPEGFQALLFEREEKFDMYVIGLQESTYSISNKNASGDACIPHLINHLKTIMGSNYHMLEHCYRAQLQLYIFVANHLKDKITNIETKIENTGILHVFPNKGGLVLGLEVEGTKLAFVSTHLAAHEGIKYCNARNESIIEILNGARIGNTNLDITHQYHHVFWMGDMNYRLTSAYDKTPKNKKKNIGVAENSAQVSALKKQDTIVLNLNDIELDADPLAVSNRTDKSDDNLDEDDEDDEDKDLPTGKKELKKAFRNKVLDLISKSQWDELMKTDELNREIAAGRIMNGFIALTPNFPPTFKRARNVSFPKSFLERKGEGLLISKQKSMNVIDVTSDTDQLPPSRMNSGSKFVDEFYNEKRIPSYTDRILYKSMSCFEDNIDVLFFESCELAISSDHKPVRAGFTIDITQGERAITVDKKIFKSIFHPHSVLRLQFSNMKGRNLEELDLLMFGGGSDPYIAILTDPAPLLLPFRRNNSTNIGIRSKVIKHNLNPEWHDSIVINLASRDKFNLCNNASIILQIWDKDNYSDDDLIGATTIPLKDIFGEQPYNFKKDIYTNCEIMGTVSGTITILQTGGISRSSIRHRSSRDNSHNVSNNRSASQDTGTETGKQADYMDSEHLTTLYDARVEFENSASCNCIIS
eukprot:gene7396-10080_t